MREITIHQIDGLPEGFARDLVVQAGEPDRFGVPHEYHFWSDPHNLLFTLRLQSGDPRIQWNGGTSLSILAAIYDFLASCQASQFACGENLQAMYGVKTAITALQDRIRRRAAEGTFQTHQAEKPPVDKEDD